MAAQCRGRAVTGPNATRPVPAGQRDRRANFQRRGQIPADPYDLPGLRLAQLRTQLIDQGVAPATLEQAGVAGLFLPWAVQHPAEIGGIYWVGAATEGACGTEGDQSFETCHERAARLCDRGSHARTHTPLWLFLDGLTQALLGGSYDAALDHTVLLARNLLPRFA